MTQLASAIEKWWNFHMKTGKIFQRLNDLRDRRQLPAGSWMLTWFLAGWGCLVVLKMWWPQLHIEKAIRFTPWKINMEPQNGGLEDEFPFQLL